MSTSYSVVPNAALTATANSIRTKSGSQSSIEFDHNTGFADAVDAIPSGGPNLSWIAEATPSPSFKNMLYALINGETEHGEFTLASTPTNTFVDLFTLTTITAPPQGIIIFDKLFYQGMDATTLPNNGNTDAQGFMWFDKCFLNPARETAIGGSYPKYGYVNWSVTQTVTAAGGGGGATSIAFDGETDSSRGYWLFNGNTLTWKSRFGGQQYTTFVAGRTYVWMAY